MKSYSPTFVAVNHQYSNFTTKLSSFSFTFPLFMAGLSWAYIVWWGEIAAMGNNQNFLICRYGKIDLLTTSSWSDTDKTVCVWDMSADLLVDSLVAFGHVPFIQLNITRPVDKGTWMWWSSSRNQLLKSSAAAVAADMMIEHSAVGQLVQCCYLSILRFNFRCLINS